jgi:hypothetical protein
LYRVSELVYLVVVTGVLNAVLALTAGWLFRRSHRLRWLAASSGLLISLAFAVVPSFGSPEMNGAPPVLLPLALGLVLPQLLAIVAVHQRWWVHALTACALGVTGGLAYYFVVLPFYP